MNILDRLNDAQRAAVTHIDGPLLILAGPGSGKTRVVTHRIAYMLEQGIDPRNILALTFTNKAAQEMRSRIEALTGKANLWIGTYHGFCARLLRRYAPLVGLPENYSIYDTRDSTAVLKQAVERADVSLSHMSLDSIAKQISDLKSRLITPENLLAQARTSDEFSLARLYPVYQQELLRCGAVDFDCMLMHVAVMLRNSPELRQELDEKFRYILVDEYQDTNLAQYVIVRSMSITMPNLSVTGDPDQSIYGWRGADLQNILNFEKDYPKVKVVRLEENYRSTPQILAAADFLIQHNERRKAKNLIPVLPTGPRVRLRVYNTGREEANNIVDQILHGCTEEGESPSQYAILYRTNAQSRLFEQALRSRNLPFQLIGGFQFYQRQEVKDLTGYLHLLHNPDDNIAFRRVVNIPPRGVGAKSLKQIQEISDKQRISMLEAARVALEGSKITGRAKKGIEEFIILYDQLCTIATGPLADLLRLLIERIKYEEYLNSQKTSEDETGRMANVDELLSDADELDRQHPEGGTLEVFLEQLALQSDTDRWEGSNEQVTLMTLHAAKGLEFRHVYVTAIEQDILPHIRSKDDPAQMEEERRLLFVGITRAKHFLQLSSAKHRSWRGNDRISVVSPFLMELPRSEMETIYPTDLYDYSSDEMNDYNQASPHDDYDEAAGRWDDAVDITHGPSTEEPAIDWDADMCQLPPEEIMARKKPSTIRLQIQTASQLISQSEGRVSPMQFAVGRVVSHPKYGSGRIIAASGRGPKRTVSVEFYGDSQRHEFRVSHAPLTLEDEI